jgi:hypothetical protein
MSDEYEYEEMPICDNCKKCRHDGFICDECENGSEYEE